ncbi:hypothetical protein RF11_10663 [Thelohanellus kitauei]|uniref:Uncharacterized protein n=1 Tax=Thelohanellus kitauei TaxID=669202 RepID=A0A0C2MZB6_THEKT|nr:hypothetical protein RF11_10663 [Thelohanellus kitauei]
MIYDFDNKQKLKVTLPPRWYVKILIHPILPGVIIANIGHEWGEWNTYISTDNGIKFDKMKMKGINSDDRKSLVYAPWKHRHVSLENILFANERIMVKYEFDYNHLIKRYFILYSDELILKLLPFTNIEFINEGTIIVGLNTTSSNIMFSFDEGHIFYKFPIKNEYKSSYYATTIGKYENETLIIYGKNQNNSQFLITRVDFTRIFSKLIR